MKLRGRLALVTGASGGIGAATTRALAARGCRVILLARRQAELERVAASLGGSAVAALHSIDLTDPDSVSRVASRITSDLGTPDIVVNNAGAGQWKFVEETSPAEAMQMMAAPYFAAFFVTQAFLPGMLARNSGHLVFVSSTASRFVWPGATAYTAARWAVRGFSTALRADLARTGVGVTLFEGGLVESEYWARNPGSRERVPGIGRLIPSLTPETAAQAIVRGIERNRKLVVVPLALRMMYLQDAIFPGLVQWLMTRTGHQRPLSA